MRHLTKRLLAGVLALALLCGANTAFAVEAKIYTGSHATGSTTNEGTVTEGLVNVVLPSVQEDFFDFVLDPGNCIASTNAAAYNGIAYREGSVYFRSLADNGEVLLSPDSHPLTIINKGVVPVEADVSLKVNKGQYDFTFADTPDFLDANGNAISGNAMYLALASGRRTAPVKSSTDETGNTVYSASLRNWIGVTENTHDVVWNPDTEAYGYVIKDGLTDDDFQSASFYVTGEISDGDWEEAESGINLSVVWDIYYSQSDDSESPYSDPDIEPSVRVKTGTREAGGTVVLRVDMGAGANLMTYIDRVSYLHSNGTVGTIDQLSLEAVNFYTNTVTFSAPSDILNGSDWKLCFSNGNGGSAEVPFDPVAEEVFEPDPAVTVLSKASEAGDTVIMDVYFGHGETAYPYVERLEYTKADGTPTAFLGLSRSNASDTGVTVSLTANSTLLAGRDWKLILSNDAGQTTALDAAIYDATAVPQEPSVTVNSKASVVGDRVSLTVSYGSGATAYPYVDQIVYDSGTIAKSALTIEGQTITFAATEAILAGRNWKLQLSNKASETFLMDIDIYEEPAVDPTVTVTSKASASGDTATMTVDWGAGAKAMTSVSKITYKKSGGTAATIKASSSSLTVNGNTVSLTFDATTIKGTDFVLVLTNASSETKEFPVDLVEPAQETGTDPTVTVTSKASASGDTATMTVDWGTGSKAMTSVSKITYKKSGGTAATIKATSSALTVSGNTVSLTFTDTSIQGTDFVLVLTNDSGETKEFPVDLVEATQEETGTDPTVTVTSKASASGDTATMTVDWGTGSKAMTSVSKISYKKSTGAAANITSATYLKTNGNTVSLTFTATSIQGTDFVLVLTNDSGETKEFPVDLVEPAQEETGTDPTVTVTKTAGASGDTATMTVNWGTGSKAMTSVSKVTYKKSTGASASITSATYLKTNGNTVSLTFTATTIQGTDFVLVLTNDNGETKEFPVDLVEATQEETGTDPTVTVTKTAGASGDTATMTVNWGTGSKAMTSVSKVTYKKSTGTSASITSATYLKTNGNTVSLTFTATSIQGTDFVLVLANDSGATKEFPVDLVQIVQDTGADPTVTVTKTASASGDTATMTVNWGSGSKAMTSVSQITYKKSTGAAASIATTSSALSVSGNTVSLTFNATTIKGTNFVLVLANSSGETKEFPVILVGAAQSSGTDPTVTINNKASASGDTAVMTINWGSGDKAMTSVSKINYTKSTGAAASIATTSSALTVSGSTVSLTFNATTIKGKNFVLVLANSNGGTIEIPVDLIA